MTDYLTEQEQIDLLKNWIKQYSLVIISGILIAVVVMSGWRYWQQRQAKILSHASAVYDEMLAMRAQNDTDATLVQAQKLITHYPQTTYGQMAALTLARNAILKKDFKEAEKQFNWVIDHSKVSSIRQIARIRLARLMIAENKPKEGITVVQKVDDSTFNGVIEEVKGDAYLAMKEIDKARQSYQAALTALPNAESIRPLLQMKYDNLIT